ncbi:MAG: hypothetical protein QE493_06885 [Verrucomicrobiae bacterium]|jgi:Asp-tRNA(Asn)/Glu-tRNA(Gln) amidotransferase A subunit family amidase|nr:hypothetical protein [Verrucomicrobiae bacterium]
MEPSLRDAYLERPHYERDLLLKKNNPYPEIAALWEKAAHALTLYKKNSEFFSKHHPIDTFPLELSLEEKFSIAKLVTCYATQSIKVIASGNTAAAIQIHQAIQSIQRAAHCYEYWTSRANKEAIHFYTIKENDLLEMVKMYRFKQLEAETQRNPVLAQQWAEAACLAQDAEAHVKKISLLVATKDKPSSIYSFLFAAYWAKEASLSRAHVAELIAKKEKKEAHQAELVALGLEKASTYRSKAAKKELQKATTSSHYWTMAAYWASWYSTCLKKENPGLKKGWKLAEKIMKAYVETAKYNQSTTPLRIFWKNFWVRKALHREREIKILF